MTKRQRLKKKKEVRDNRKLKKLMRIIRARLAKGDSIKGLLHEGN